MFFQAGKELLGFFEQLVQHRLGAGDILRVVAVLGAGADEQVSVDGGGQVDPQPPRPRLGDGVYREGEDILGYLVQDVILPPAGVEAIALRPRHGGHLGAVEPGAVDDKAGVEVPATGGDGEARLLPADGGDLVAEKEGGPVGMGVLRQGYGVEEGVKNPGLRGEHPPNAPQLGELAAQAVLVQHGQAVAAVALPLGHELKKGGHVLQVEGQEQLAGFLVGHVQFLAQGFKAPVALHAQVGHEAAGGIVEPSVDHGGVAPTGPGGHVCGSLHQGDGAAVTGQLAGHGAAHRAAADDEDIKL